MPEVPGGETPPSAPHGPGAAHGPTSAADLPVPNYDDISIASLRARLRNLSADDVRALAGYEREHANRADVVAMLDRRVAKLAGGGAG